MATHIISFRIASDADHGDRWSSTVEAIRAQADAGETWEETTSFILLRSLKSADGLASAIYRNSSFDAGKDTLLVVDVTNSAHATKGLVHYPHTLASFFSAHNLSGLMAG